VAAPLRQINDSAKRKVAESSRSPALSTLNRHYRCSSRMTGSVR
jgi:hypothetical protein